MDKELMPCPFCGSAPLVNIIEPHKHGFSGMPDHPGSCAIECGCGAGLIDDTQELVSNRWNTRSESSGEPAQLEKAPEPVYQTEVDNDTWMDIDKNEHDFLESRNTNVRVLFTSPPEVAELQKQVQVLQIELHSLQTIKDAQYSVLKENFDDACKMLKDAQADNERLHEFEAIWGDDDESRAKLHVTLLKHGYGKENALHLAGCTDYDSIKESNASLQAKIDALMLEFCPDRMAEAQKENWADHQKAVKDITPAEKHTAYADGYICLECGRWNPEEVKHFEGCRKAKDKS